MGIGGVIILCVYIAIEIHILSRISMLHREKTIQILIGVEIVNVTSISIAYTQH